MPTLDDLRAKYPQLAELDDTDAVDVLHDTFYRDMPRDKVEAALGIKPAEAPKKPRTWGEAGNDWGRAVMSGGAGLVKSAGDLYGLAAGDMGNPVSTAAREAQEYWTGGQSQPLKDKQAARKAAIDAADGTMAKFFAAAKETITDPALMADTVLGNVATMIPGAAVGRGVMGLMSARAAAAGLSGEALAAAGQAGARVATGAAVGTGALQQGADVSAQAYDDSMKKTAEQLAANPDYVRRVRAGEAPRDVAMSLGLSAARAAFLPAAAISVAANAIPGGTMLERALIGGAARDTVKAGTKFALAKSILKAGAGEAAQETVEEGGGQFAANLAKRAYVDPNQDVSEDVGENAGMGFAGGLGMGIPGGALHRQHSGQALPPGVPPPIDPNALKLPDTGPMSRAVNRGLDAEAATPAPPAAPPLPTPTAEEAASLLDFANKRAAEIERKAKGEKGQKITGPDGKPITTPDVQPEFLSPDEKAEREFLKEHGGDAAALALVYPVGTKAGAPAEDPIAQQAKENEAGLKRATADKAKQRAAKQAPAAEPAPAPAAPEVRNPPEDSFEPKRPDDIVVQATGLPFKNMLSATNTQKRMGDDYEVKRVNGGLVVRKKETATGAPAAPVAQPAPQAAAEKPTGAPDAEVAQPNVQRNQQGTDDVGLPVPPKAQEVNPAPSPQSAPVATPAAPAAVDEHGDWWTRATSVERGAVLARAGWAMTPKPSISGDKVMHTSWADLKQSTKDRIAAARNPAPAAATDAQQAPKQPAPAPEAPRAEAPAPAGAATAAEPAAVVPGAGSAPVETAGLKATEAPTKAAEPVQADSGSAAPAPVAAAPTAAPRKKTSAQAKAYAAREAKRADYFTPGNVVKSYSGHDRVLSYTPAGDSNSRWSVKVEAVRRGKGESEWVSFEHPRQHSTEPEAKNLADGPVQRAAPAAVPAPAPKADKAEVRPYRREDGSIGYEAVPIVKAEPAAAPASIAGAAQEARDDSPVVQFGRAMRDAGLELDGLDTRLWSKDLGSGHEVHVRLMPGDATVAVTRFAGGKVAESWDGDFGADATRKVREFMATSMQAPAAASKDQGLHYATGKAAFERGEARALPSFYSSSAGKNPKEFFRGWDEAKADAGAKPAAAPPPATNNESLTVDPDADKKAKALADLNDALGDLAGIFGKDFKASMLPEQEQKLMPVLTRAMDAAFRAGHYSFKQAARFVLDTIRAKISPEVADSISLDHLQGAYIGMSGKYRDQGATPKKEVVGVESLDELGDAAGPAVAPQGGTADTAGKTTEQPNGAAARELDRAGKPALEGAPAAPVQGAGGSGPAGASAESGGAGHVERPANAAGAGDRPGGSVGNGAGAAPVPTGGTGGERGGAAKPRVSGAARPARNDEQGADAGREGGPGGIGDNPAPNAGPINPPQIAPQDFRISDDLALGEGGPKTKYRNNVAAIRLLKELEATGRVATAAEQKTLALYVGWGQLSQAFDAAHKDWTSEYAELKALLTPSEYAAAEESTQYAHYTSRQIVDGIYGALAHMGFTGGRMVEPGSGVGNFIGRMPDALRSSTRFTGIEREAIAAGIAKQLYPQQNIQFADFTEFVGNDAYFDAAIGNPPFARTALTDQSGRKHLTGLSVHNYFFAKAVDMLREGGILAQVVSNSFLDAKRDTARRYIAERVEFLGAIRLPNNAFAKNAGTEVTTDIVFLKKLPESQWDSRAGKENRDRWLDTKKVPDPLGGEPLQVNAYFADNPDMMLGELGRFGTMYGPDQPALRAKPGQDTAALFQAAIARLPANVYTAPAEANTKRMNDQAVEALTNPTVREGGHFVRDGTLYRRLDDQAGEARMVKITPETPWTAKTALGMAGYERLVGLAQMRETLRDLLAAELTGDKRMEGLRKRLNVEYDAYVQQHGLINSTPSVRVFDDDPDFPLLASLEHNYTPAITPDAAKKLGIKPVKATAKKGPIFTARVVDERRAPTRAASASDALTISMAERGRINAAYIGTLLGKPADEALKALSEGEKPLLFLDPATREYVLRDAYLSGNVRAKLAQAREAGMFANSRALEAVQPEDVGAHEISVRIGSPWVPVSVYEDFAKHLFGEGTKARFTYVPSNSSYSGAITAGSEVAATNTWGTHQFTGPELLNSLMNNRDIKVTYRDADKNLRTDKEATEAANDKANEIRQAFDDWTFADSDRAELLGKAYNETNNNYVTRAFDGGYMNFPGKVPDSIIKFRRHQRNAIARIVQDRTALLDHVVGAGKTFTVISGAMELKRTGLANKPLVVVPNHLVKQWASDFYRLYPAANVLTATKEDFKKENRRKFLAKIATGDWDAVVMAHSSFGFVRPAPEFEERFNAEQVAKIVQTINAVENSDTEERAKKRTVKQLAALKERLENRIAALRQKPIDALLDFKELGVDQLFVDEAHLFKNLMFTTKMQNVRGLGDSKGSQHAYDLFVKAHQLYEQNGRGQGVVFATGTPVSNSLAEMYHMMRYLMPQAMKDGGFESFDAWANTFTRVEQELVSTAAGGYKNVTNMGKFMNAHELLKLFDQVSDTVTMDDVKAAYRDENEGREFPLPKLKGDKRQPVPLEQSEAQKAYMANIVSRAAAIEGKRSEKGGDNPLKIMGDARKVAMDIRLVDPDVTAREPGSRIDRAASEILDRWNKYSNVKGTQLVFSDLGTPIKHAKAELKEWEALQARINKGSEPDTVTSANLGNEAAMALVDDAEDAQHELDEHGADWLDAVKAALRGFSVYDDLKAALMERGIPEHEIAFIHDYNTDDQKAALFRKVNAGDIRVLIGSTPKLGAGTNVQQRLVALHHLDIPWRPSDVEQREGRIIRQGNVLDSQIPGFEVEILAYVTKDTLDKRMWEIQEKKLRGINQLRTRKVGREIDNSFEDMEMSASEMQAAATGNLDLLKEIQLGQDVKKLERELRSFNARRSDLESRRKRAERQVKDIPGQLATAKELAVLGEAYKAEAQAHRDAFKVTINGKEYTDSKDAGQALQDIIDQKVYKWPTKKKGEPDQVLTQAQYDALEPMMQQGWKAAPLPISVDMNGTTYTARAALADAFADLRGDVVNPPMWHVDGQVYTRITNLAKALAARVAEAIADQKVVSLGTIGGFRVTVEGQEPDRMGVTRVETVIAAKGHEVSTTTSASGFDGKAKDPQVVAEYVIHGAQSMATGNTYKVQFLEEDLKRAKKALDELDAAGPMGDAFPGEAALAAARAAHKEVLQRLQQSDLPEVRGDGSEKILSGPEYAKFMGSPIRDALKDRFVVVTEGGIAYRGAPKDGFTTREEATAWVAQQAAAKSGSGTASETPAASRGAGAGMDPEALREQVKQIAKGWANGPRGGIHVVDTNDDVPKQVRSSDKAGDARAWFDPRTGAVYLVADRLGSPEEAQFALFHEVYGHYGMRAVLGDAYADTMMRLRAANNDLATQASFWFAHYGQTEVQARINAGMAPGAAAREVRLLSTEEALADRAGEGKRQGMFKSLLAAVQKGLRAIGLDAVADWMENRTDSEVMDLLQRARDAVRSGGRVHALTGAVPAMSRAGDPTNLAQRTIGPKKDGTYLARIEAIRKQIGDEYVAGKINADEYRARFDATNDQYVEALRQQQKIDEALPASQLEEVFPGFTSVPVGTKVMATHGLTYKEPTRATVVGSHDMRVGKLAFRYPVVQFEGEDRPRRLGYQDLKEVFAPRPVAPSGGMASRTNTLDALRDVASYQGITNAVNDAMRTRRTFNSWWHRTVGTQYHKAQVDPEHFAPVYHAGQDYLHDTSALANDAAALAPDLLPQLKSLRDLKRLGYKQADRDAVAQPIFQGTLAGELYSAEQLRDDFGLTPQQIKLYGEFRASVDRSLDTLVASDVARFMQISGKLLSKAQRQMVADGDVARFKGQALAIVNAKQQTAADALEAVKASHRAEVVRFNAEQKQAFEDAGKGARLTIEQAWADRSNKMRADHAAELADAQAEAAKWKQVADVVKGKYEKVEKLQEQGYAPLMRFGKYTLTQRDSAGEVSYFSMFENERDANRMHRMLAGEQGYTLEQGVMSQEAFKQFRGMTPETMGLFADLAGVEKSDVLQQYLRLAVANRSALKRMIHRKGTAGFSEDVSRVLSSFITSNARGASGNLHLGEMSEAVAAIPKHKGDVLDEAQRLQAYITDPQEEAQALRGLMFTTFIGGSVASALSNMTQPLTTTLPWLSQHSNPAAAAAEIAKAMVTAAKGTTDPALKAALKKAEDEGIVSPQEVHQLQAEASRGLGNNRGVRAALFLWGSVFALAEQANRRISFIAAYNTAKAKGMRDPFTFAADAVDATQFVYNKGNRPDWARGALGATLFTFKQFSISYLEMFKRLPTRERALALAVLMLAAGAQGLPFADDLDDLVDTIAQGLGYDLNSKQAKTRFLTEHLGAGGADFVMRGLSAIPGVPLDVAGRMSLGNLIPATGLMLKSKTDKGQEIAEALGPVGGIGQNVGKLMHGDPLGMAPTAIQNIAKGLDMYRTGMYRDGKGRKVMDTDGTDALVKAIGFQPAEIARESRKISIGQQQIALAKAQQADIVSSWAQGIFEQDADKVASAQKALREWNEKNPESRITVTRPAIVAQVRAMHMTREQRFIKAAPKGMRATVLANGE